LLAVSLLLVIGSGWLLLGTFSPQITYAQDGAFVPLSDNLPTPIQNAFNDANGGDTIGALINGFFIVSIGVAALLAVIMIAIAGIQYMGSDAYSSKSDAKDRIRSAVIGLLLILGAFLLLYTINPDLVNLDPLQNVQQIQGPGGGGAAGGGGGQGAGNQGGDTFTQNCQVGDACTCPDGSVQQGGGRVNGNVRTLTCLRL